MARPLQDGVDYFPKDTDFYFDNKVRMLRAEFGAKGMYILDYILCEIYRQNGYFLKWDKSSCLLVSDGAGCGCSPDYISEFISGCIRCSLFDERVLKVFGVLTSAGIQRRYIRMFNSRNNIQMIKEYWLLDCDNEKDVSPSILNKLTFKSIKITENPNKSKENPNKSKENSLNKKESKIKDTNVSQNKTNNIDSVDVPDEIKTQWDGYVEMRNKIKKPLTKKAMIMALKKLDILAPNNYTLQGQILDQSTFNCWQGLFSLKNSGGDANAEHFKPSRT